MLMVQSFAYLFCIFKVIALPSVENRCLVVGGGAGVSSLRPAKFGLYGRDRPFRQVYPLVLREGG